MMELESDSVSFEDKESDVDNVGMKKRMDLGTDFAKELEVYRKRCLELEEKSKKAEVRCLALEVEVKVLKKKNEELEEQITRIRKVASEGEKGKGIIVDLTDEENEGDEFGQLMIENKVLECEKKKAESELGDWIWKVKELESRLYELGSKVKMKAMNESSMDFKDGLDAGTGKTHLDTDRIVIGEEKIKEANNVVTTPQNTVAGDVNWQSSGTPYLPDEREERGGKKEYRSQVRKRLPFEEDGSANKMAPCTPAGARPPLSGVIDISDEDADPNGLCKPSYFTPEIKKISDSGDHGDLAKSECSSKNDMKKTDLEHSGEEDLDGFDGHSSITKGAKRKRASNLVTSDDEEDNDDFRGHPPITTRAKSKRASNIVTHDNVTSDDDKEDIDGFKENSPIAVSAKRKRASNILTSVGETNDDDNAPICTLKRQQHNPRLKTDSEDEVKEDVSRRCSRRLRKPETKDTVTDSDDEVKEDLSRRRSRRLRKSETKDSVTDSEDEVKEDLSRRRSKRLRKLETKNSPRRQHSPVTDSEDEVKEDASRRRATRSRKSETKDRRRRSTFDLNKTVVSLYGNDSSENEEDNAGSEYGSESSESESLGGFIVDNSESASGSSVSCDESEEASDDFKETIDKIRRKRGPTLKWDLEGTMLADFGKDPELCMRAVCALYRRQTADEKLSKGTIHLNERGFSQCDATRGSKLAEFLTDGDSNGDLNKTVEELKAHDPKGIKLCMALATKYSKQLFEIYQNKEDPYFLPL